MIITDKQKCIAEQAIYRDLKQLRFYEQETIMGFEGDKVIVNERVIGIMCLNTAKDWDEIKPILRPLDLIEEITHKGYNNGEPFIPLMELVKISQNATKTDPLKLVNDTVVDSTNAYHFKQNVMWYQSLQGEKKAYPLPNQNRFFDLLHLWHFDTRNLIANGEAINVYNLDVNPYELSDLNNQI